MSPTASPFRFPNTMDREDDHQMIDPSSLLLPKSTPISSEASEYGQQSITPQPTHVDNNASASTFWPDAAADIGGSSLPSGLPMTPAWSFDHLSNATHATPPDAQSEISSRSTHTTPASASAKFIYPNSTPSRPTAISNNMIFRDANAPIQTPSTAAGTPWPSTASTSTMDHTFMPPPPPNSASQSMSTSHNHAGMQGSHNHHISLSGALTGLSPMLAGFTTSSPTFDQTIQSPTPGTGSGSSVTSPVNAQLSRPGGPIRTFSASAAIPQTTRKRSNTLMTLASSTPSASFGPSSYPYPSPRFPNSLMNHHVHPGPLPQGAAANRLNRQPSVPLMTAEPKRLFHPSPATAISPAIGADMSQMTMDDGYGRVNTGMMGLGMPMGYNSMPIGMMGMGLRATPPMEAKPPRFKPTKEQLEILIKSYDENKNPDGPAREALAKRLGPAVRPKTLQIWFQNRRSKSRAKERDANLPKPLHTRGDSSSLGHRSSASTSASKGGGNKGVDMDALKGLIHDDDANLTILPITVLSIANWTRFLMPGTGIAHPDLAATIRFPPSDQPSLYLNVVHQTDTFRIEIPISPSAMSNLQSVQNPSLNTEAVAISFELSMSTAKYAAWTEGEKAGQGLWSEVGDFTGGETHGGGKCELTGDKEILLTAFSRVQQYLASQTYPSTTSNMNAALPASSGGSWRFPSMSSSTSFPSTTGGVQTPPFELPMLTNLQTTQHQRQRSFSQPDLKSSSSGGSGDSASLSEFDLTSKAMKFSQTDASGQVPLPSTATATTSSTTGLETQNDVSGYGWNTVHSPDHFTNTTMHPQIPTPSTGQNPPLGNWGFPVTANTSTEAKATLHTPISSTMNPASLEGEGMGMTSSFNQFQTLNSGLNSITSNSNNAQPGFSAIERYPGTQSECSSEMDLGTPPFEFEDKSSNGTTATATAKMSEETADNLIFGVEQGPQAGL
ncbi:uncharacterized protein I303_100722 [Kwoniella dejecticola CBS 10117]|uniref:Homeobox domain-containing protein n=1 Tax=Kwoniella dejecticola CBS 10117 TaxID=1296121 RepID=A0AAJ8MCE1_9TREE